MPLLCHALFALLLLAQAPAGTAAWLSAGDGACCREASESAAGPLRQEVTRATPAWLPEAQDDDERKRRADLSAVLPPLLRVPAAGPRVDASIGHRVRVPGAGSVRGAPRGPPAR